MPNEKPQNKKFNAIAWGPSSPMVDGSDAKANSGFTVSFLHLPSGNSVFFKAFLLSFNETYSSDWNNESIYGRADPTGIFKGTQRKVSIGLMVPASTVMEGYTNLAKIQKLIQFLYPTYAAVGTPPARIITQSPLIRLKVMNLLTANTAEIDIDGGGTNVATGKHSITSLFNTNDATHGLLGAMGGLTVNHNVANPDLGSFEVAAGTIVPKAIELQFDFSVIHEHHIGWTADVDITSTSQSPNYPYQVDVETSFQNAAKAPAASELIKQRENSKRRNQATIDNALSIIANRDAALKRIGELTAAGTKANNQANADAIARANATGVLTPEDMDLPEGEEG